MNWSTKACQCIINRLCNIVLKFINNPLTRVMTTEFELYDYDNDHVAILIHDKVYCIHDEILSSRFSNYVRNSKFKADIYYLVINNRIKITKIRNIEKLKE